MEKKVLDLRSNPCCSAHSEESDLDLYMEINNGKSTNFPSPSSAPIQGVASIGQHSESNTATYFSWPTSSKVNDAAEDRANYFGNLQKGVLPETSGRLPSGQQATTILELMTIRAFHSKNLSRCSLGTALGFRIRRGVLTDSPAILVFVERKIHKKWLTVVIPTALEGPGGIWCDVDVREFSVFGAPDTNPKVELHNVLVDGLRGSDPYVGPGSQVATQESCGTLGAIVKSRTGNRRVGFLTNRHVAVDLDYPNQKMFHPVPPVHGPSVYLGAVERATSFITDDLWYGIFAGINPETFVRADGAFIPFSEDFDIAKVTPALRGVGEIGDVHTIDLQSPIENLVGRQVIKVGRSSGLTRGTIMAYALEYNDGKGICFLTDFLVVGENLDPFDMGGDSGSLVLLKGEKGEKPKPVGIIWGGTGNRGRLKLKVGQPAVDWTSAVDLGRLLDLLELDLITNSDALEAAAREQRNTSGAGASSFQKSPAPKIFEPLPLGIQYVGLDGPIFHHGNGSAPHLEHQFIPTCQEKPTTHQNGQMAGPSTLRNNPDQFIPTCQEKPATHQNGQMAGSSAARNNPDQFIPTCQEKPVTHQNGQMAGPSAARNNPDQFFPTCQEKPIIRQNGQMAGPSAARNNPDQFFPTCQEKPTTHQNGQLAGPSAARNNPDQFFPTCQEKPTTHQNGQIAGPSALRNTPDDESFVSLWLGKTQAKRRKRSESETGVDNLN